MIVNNNIRNLMTRDKYKRFSLVLMLTHNCNLRCRYCYSGRKRNEKMSFYIASKYIRKSLSSIENGGIFELSFFGGEPLIEIDLIEKIIEYTEKRTDEKNITLKMQLTTNGTILDKPTKMLFSDPRLQISVSCDGRPEIHDLNRKDLMNKGTSEKVYKTIEYLSSINKEFTVVSVITPNNVEYMHKNILFLKQKGVRFIELNLDLWSEWSEEDISKLRFSISESVKVWKANLPNIGITWFDEKLLIMTGIYERDTCRFGNGDIAVSPRGNLYPCERLIGDDESSNKMKIDDDVFSDDNFLSEFSFPERNCSSCKECSVDSMCATDCRCSNYIRTGDVSIPDRLLCIKEKECLQAVSNEFNSEKGGKNG